MNTQSARVYDNSNSGALYGNGAPLDGPLARGVWENGQGHKFGLIMSADVNGVRQLAVITRHGTVFSKGTVRAVRSAKGPAYRGQLGKLTVVLWNMGTYFQVREDRGAPMPTLQADALDILNAGTAQVDDEEAPF